MLKAARIGVCVCATASIGWLLSARIGAQYQVGREHWVGTWSTALASRTLFPAASPTDSERGRGGRGGRNGAPAEPTIKRLPNGFVDSNPQDANAPLSFENQTYRQNMRTTIGGERVRVVFSNRFGQTRLHIGAASIALRGKDSAIIAGSARPLTFTGGSTEVTIEPHQDYISDAVVFSVPALTDVSVDMYLPEHVGSAESPLTYHLTALNDSYVSEPGNHVGGEHFPVARDTQSSYFIARVEVVAPPSTGAIIVVGDSTTDGARNGQTNARWPNVLADRLHARQGARMAVLSAAYGGNSLLAGGGAVDGTLARFDRDVLSQTGATHVLVLQGLVDIWGPAGGAYSVQQVIAGLRQVIARSRDHGLKVIGATITPFGSSGQGNATGEEKRQAINAWIRTSGEFDGVVDFAKAVEDQAKPSQYLKELSLDGAHPNELGCKKMGEAIDLSLFAPPSTKR